MAEVGFKLSAVPLKISTIFYLCCPWFKNDGKISQRKEDKYCMILRVIRFMQTEERMVAGVGRGAENGELLFTRHRVSALEGKCSGDGWWGRSYSSVNTLMPLIWTPKSHENGKFYVECILAQFKMWFFCAGSLVNWKTVHGGQGHSPNMWESEKIQ